MHWFGRCLQGRAVPEGGDLYFLRVTGNGLDILPLSASSMISRSLGGMRGD